MKYLRSKFILLMVKNAQFPWPTEVCLLLKHFDCSEGGKKDGNIWGWGGIPWKGGEVAEEWEEL